MSFTEDQIKELQKKLDPTHVKPPKQFGPKGDYIEGWHAIAEANRIFGFDAWSYAPVSCECVHQGERPIGRDKKPGWGVTYIARVSVTIDSVTREDVGAGHGYDVDCGLAHESAIKEAVTDALKRALRSFGNPFGLALYDKSGANVGVDQPPPEDQRKFQESEWLSKRAKGPRLNDEDSAKTLQVMQDWADICENLQDLNAYFEKNEDKINGLCDRDYIALKHTYVSKRASLPKLEDAA